MAPITADIYNLRWTGDNCLKLISVKNANFTTLIIAVGLCSLPTICRFAFARQPHWVQYPAAWTDAKELVRHRDHVKVRLLAVVKIRVRLPQTFQRCHAHLQSFQWRVRIGQSTIDPALTKIAVHLEGLFWNNRQRPSTGGGEILNNQNVACSQISEDYRLPSECSGFQSKLFSSNCTQKLIN